MFLWVRGLRMPSAWLTTRWLEKGSIAAENHSVDALEQETGSGTSFGRSIYKNLMNGVSHMLPLLLPGGVLIAISFAVWGIYSFDPENTQYNATAAMLKAVGDAAMGMMVPVLAAYIAEGIAKRPGLVVGFVGGIVAMNGGTGFLGGILAGFLAGYFILFLQKSFRGAAKTARRFESHLLVSSHWCSGDRDRDVFTRRTDEGCKWRHDELFSWLWTFESFSPGVIVGCMCAFDMAARSQRQPM